MAKYAPDAVSLQVAPSRGGNTAVHKQEVMTYDDALLEVRRGQGKGSATGIVRTTRVAAVRVGVRVRVSFTVVVKVRVRAKFRVRVRAKVRGTDLVRAGARVRVSPAPIPTVVLLLKRSPCISGCHMCFNGSLGLIEIIPAHPAYNPT